MLISLPLPKASPFSHGWELSLHNHICTFLLTPPGDKKLRNRDAWVSSFTLSKEGNLQRKPVIGENVISCSQQNRGTLCSFTLSFRHIWRTFKRKAASVEKLLKAFAQIKLEVIRKYCQSGQREDRTTGSVECDVWSFGRPDVLKCGVPIDPLTLRRAS